MKNKNKNLTLPNLSHLCELGFRAMPNPRIFVAIRHRVVFSEIDNSLKVELLQNRRWRAWRVETFFDALTLLEKLGVGN